MKRTIEPPLGFSLTKEVNVDNEKDILELCEGLSDDKKFLESIKGITHKERLKFLKDNGFEVIKHK